MDTQMTWQFASVPYIHDRTRPLEIADELESFFYILVYGAVRFLHSTCPPSRVEFFLDGFFDHDYIEDVGWAASTWKRYALEHARIFMPPHGDELRFLGSDGGGEKAPAGRRSSDTPLNSLMEELLSWFHARFVRRFGPGGVALDERHFVQMDHPPDIRKDPHLAELDVAVLARKLEGHSATLELLERKLAEDWPEHDFAGDRLVNKPSEPPLPSAIPEEEEPPPDPEPRRRESIETLTRKEEEEVLTVLLLRKTNERKHAQKKPMAKAKAKTKTTTKMDARPRAVVVKIVVAANKLPVAPRRSKRLRHEPPSDDLEENRRPKRQCRR